MRLWVGLPVPVSDVYGRLTMEIRSQSQGARPVPKGSWHITARFLGDMPSHEPVGAALEHALDGQPALNSLIEGLGAFPDEHKATVAFARVEAVGLDTLVHKVQAATATMGQKETHPFHPHVTLARLSHPTDLKALCDQNRRTGFAEGWLDRVVLYRSVPGEHGVVHNPVHTVVLQRPID